MLHCLLGHAAHPEISLSVAETQLQTLRGLPVRVLHYQNAVEMICRFIWQFLQRDWLTSRRYWPRCTYRRLPLPQYQ